MHIIRLTFRDLLQAEDILRNYYGVGEQFLFRGRRDPRVRRAASLLHFHCRLRFWARVRLTATGLVATGTAAVCAAAAARITATRCPGAGRILAIADSLSAGTRIAHPPPPSQVH